MVGSALTSTTAAFIRLGRANSLHSSHAEYRHSTSPWSENAFMHPSDESVCFSESLQCTCRNSLDASQYNLTSKKSMRPSFVEQEAQLCSNNRSQAAALTTRPRDAFERRSAGPCMLLGRQCTYRQALKDTLPLQPLPQAIENRVQALHLSRSEFAMHPKKYQNEASQLSMDFRLTHPRAASTEVAAPASPPEIDSNPTDTN